MLKIDLHIHTVASGHAFSTINEIAKYASEKKMKVIGISDHGEELESSLTHKIYFNTLVSRVPGKMYGVRILKSVEANIINNKGELDIDSKSMEKLDYVIAAFHRDTSFKDKGEDINTKIIIKAMNNKKLKILSHPYHDWSHIINISKVSKEACKRNILLEVNISTFSKKNFMKDERYINKLKEMLKVVKKYNKKVIVNSDAHWISEVCNDDILKNIKKKIGLNDDMIINNYPKELEKILGVKF